jgi:xanthine dehydrogenase accessory factor
MSNFDDIIARASELRAQGQSYALVTVIKTIAPTSANVGDKALVTAEGRIHGWVGGGCAQPAVIRTVQLCVSDGQPRHIRITPEKNGEQVIEDVLEFGMPCHSGGTIELFIDPVMAKPEIVVLGESPVAEALIKIAPNIGFRATWLLDSQVEVNDARILPLSASKLIHPGAYVVVATQGQNDLPRLKLALSLQARHVAFVASQRKADIIKESLQEAGMDPLVVERIESPAGYPINAKTPEEIALSILAAFVARSRNSTAVHACHEEHGAPAMPKASDHSTFTAVTRTHESHASCCSTHTQNAGEAAPIEHQQPDTTTMHDTGSCCSSNCVQQEHK